MPSIDKFKQGEVLTAKRMNQLAEAAGVALTPGAETVNIPGMGQPRRRAATGACASAPATPIYRAKVASLLTAPWRVTANRVKDDGTIDIATTITIYFDVFANPTAWNAVTPAIEVGGVIPYYAGNEIVSGEARLYCLWPLVALGDC